MNLGSSFCRRCPLGSSNSAGTTGATPGKTGRGATRSNQPLERHCGSQRTSSGKRPASREQRFSGVSGSRSNLKRIQFKRSRLAPTRPICNYPRFRTRRDQCGHVNLVIRIFSRSLPTPMLSAGTTGLGRYPNSTRSRCARRAIAARLPPNPRANHPAGRAAGAFRRSGKLERLHHPD